MWWLMSASAVDDHRVDRFWSSPQGRRLQRQARRQRTAHIVVQQEPRQKGRAGRHAASEFRKIVSEQLSKQRGWPRPRAELAIDMHFTTTSRQPPSLAKLPKHYLDLLGPYSVEDEDHPLLYNDDGSVGMLFASAHNRLTSATGRGDKASIGIIARTSTDALADMALAYEIVADEGPAPSWDHDDDLYDEFDWGERRETIAWFRSQAGSEAQRAAELLEHFDRRELQRRFLERNDAGLTDVVLHSAHRLIRGYDPSADRLRRLHDRLTERGHRAAVAGATELMTSLLFHETLEYRDQLLQRFDSITLPSLPRTRGDGTKFRERLDATLRKYAAGRPLLFPLVEPIRITVLVIPPNRNPRSAKDLDNILIDVMGSIGRHFKSSAERGIAGLPHQGVDIAGECRTQPVAEESSDGRLRSLTNTAIWSYQVLELARHADDSPEGVVQLVLGHGLNMYSIWDEASRYVDDYFDDRRY